MPDDPNLPHGHSEQSPPRLSSAQWKLLTQIASYPYGEGYVRPIARRSADILVKAGLLRACNRYWYAVTTEGRKAAEA